MIDWLLSALLLLGALVYYAFTHKIFRGLGNLRTLDKVEGNYQPTVSVIVPARNEDHNIEETLDSLSAQNYPQDKLQVVMVNDRSEDHTPGIMARYDRKYVNFLKVDINSISADVSPKKNALEWGIAASQGEIIITTDADCVHSPKWVSEIVRYFRPEVGLVAGLTIFDPDDESWAHRLHSFDYLSHSFIGAGAIGAGEGMNCTGANLAYRYQAFIELQGFGEAASMVSGDDEFFLQRMIKKGKWKAVHMMGKETIVRSLPPETIKGILSQRHRWGSKGLYYPPNIKRLAMGIFFYFLMLVLAPLFILAGWMPWWIFALAAVIKISSDLSVMTRGCKIFELKFPPFVFSLLTIIHPLVILLTAVWGHLFTFRWKGGYYHSKMPIQAESVK